MGGMRLIGHLASESSARTFASYLYVQGIENQIESHNPEGWGIWVLEEDKIESATALLTAFRGNSNDPKYRAATGVASDLRSKAEKDQAAYEKRVRDRRHLFRPLREYGFGALTLVLIALSVGVFLLSHFGTNLGALRNLFIASYLREGDIIRWLPGLQEIRHGQVWRLFTPMFIHMTFLHLFFNMLWLRDLGSMIEGRQSVWHLAALVLVISGASNFAQYVVSGPDFGGMSGVVYGLLGYIWIRGRFDPGSGLYVHPATVAMMLIWFVVCLTGLMPIANTVHAVGLGIGIAWGYLSSLRHR